MFDPNSESMPSVPKIDHALRSQIKDLERKIGRIEIINAAVWELVRDKLALTGAELDAKILEIDMRDGIEDGEVSSVPVRCPACNRVSSSKGNQCLYCGQEFAGDVFT